MVIWIYICCCCYIYIGDTRYSDTTDAIFTCTNKFVIVCWLCIILESPHFWSFNFWVFKLSKTAFVKLVRLDMYPVVLLITQYTHDVSVYKFYIVEFLRIEVFFIVFINEWLRECMLCYLYVTSLQIKITPELSRNFEKL